MKSILPVFNRNIATWLRLLAGSEASRVELLDWMATAPDLSKPLRALVFNGPPGTGKTLFAQGMATLWGRGGTPEDAEGGEQCPFLFVGESFTQIKGLEAKIGALVQSRTCRVVVATNAELDLLKTRFLVVTPDPKAADFLGAQPIGSLDDWRRSKIAAHAMYLHKNQGVEP